MTRALSAIAIANEFPREAAAEPVGWAVQQLLTAAEARGLGRSHDWGDEIWRLRVTHDPEAGVESFRLRVEDSGAVIEAGDVRGAVYALLDLADRIQHCPDPLDELAQLTDSDAAPANRVRSITRIFSSRLEDSEWFYDEEFWDGYLTELATHRFNRFSLGTGPDRDFTIDKKVQDTYLSFLYPYVVEVPSYAIRIDGVSDEERARNLAMLQHIARETTRRGLDFHLGLWNHSYRLDPDDPHDPLCIHGIDETNHAAYCRDALASLLQAVPEVKGVTFRVHVEGGVREPTHPFWRTVISRLNEFPGLTDVDFHAKGVGDELIGVTQASGKRATLSVKFWGEHLGLPYHQASIRELERDPSSRMLERGAWIANATGHHESVTGWQDTARRSFTRYGYGDFLTDDRTYDIVYRVWPGTQRFLTWGDPAFAAGLGRAAGFGGAAGIEWFDMMTFKGRKDSGVEGGRELYRDEDLALGRHDWRKHRYTYRLWGRLAYDPTEDPDVWRRYLRSRFRKAGNAIERALAFASRVLPLVFTTHGPSTACAMYWPEIYTNVPVVPVPPAADNPYADRGWPPDLQFDSLAPHTFGSVGSLDPALIAGVDEHADALLSGTLDGRYSPLDVADWFDALAQRIEPAVRDAEEAIDGDPGPDHRRVAADIRILAGIARFFAGKFRAAFYYALAMKTEDAETGLRAVAEYRAARTGWEHAAAAGDVYRDDLAFGAAAFQRGHWRDRLPAIDADIAAVEQAVQRTCTPTAAHASPPVPPGRTSTSAYRHDSPRGFRRGEDLFLELSAEDLRAGRLRYRAVDQSLTYRTLELSSDGTKWQAQIPSADLPDDRAIQYFFEVETLSGDRGIVPGFDPELSNRPYFVVGGLQ